jgi:hypothetical protein
MENLDHLIKSMQKDLMRMYNVFDSASKNEENTKFWLNSIIILIYCNVIKIDKQNGLYEVNETDKTYEVNIKNKIRLCKVCFMKCYLKCECCKTSYYCCEAHQFIDWPEHKKYCNTDLYVLDDNVNIDDYDIKCTCNCRCKC